MYYIGILNFRFERSHQVQQIQLEENGNERKEYTANERRYHLLTVRDRVSERSLFLYRVGPNGETDRDIIREAEKGEVYILERHGERGVRER